MKKITVKVIVGFLGFWIITHDVCTAQIESTKYRIAEVLQINAALLKPNKCKALETLTTVVTFDSSAKVENVFLSDSDDCLKKNIEAFKMQLTTELNGLNLEKETFSNGYILFVLFVRKIEDAKTTSLETNSILSLFKNLDESVVTDKELKFWLPAILSVR